MIARATVWTESIATTAPEMWSLLVYTGSLYSSLSKLRQSGNNNRAFSKRGMNLS